MKRAQLRAVGTRLVGGFACSRLAAGRSRAAIPSGAIASLLLIAVVVAPAAAQGPVPGIGRPPERVVPLPEFEPSLPGAPLRLPPVGPEPQPGGAASGPRVFVREFRLSGHTVFTREQLAEVVAPYEGRAISNEELEEVRHRLNLFYVNRGYINSGAILPDQTMVDGVVEIHIVEGRVTDIEVEGNDSLAADYVSQRLALGAGPPLNVNTLHERMQLLLQTPFIERINADLKPGTHPGEASLHARIEETRPYQLSFAIDNDLSPSQGEVRGRAHGLLLNPTGAGDVVNVEAAFARGLHDLTLAYTRPLGARDTTLGVSLERSRSEVVEEPFDLLDIESEYWAWGLRLRHPVFRTVEQQFSVSMGLDRRHSQTFLLGRGFAFSPGVSADGDSDVTVLRLGQEWVERTRTQVVAVRSTFNIGLNLLGATSNNTGPDGEFFSWLAQFQWARRLGDRGAQAIFRADAQLTNHQLLPIEQFSVGGVHSVRGYRQNQLVRDWGYNASLEIRIPVTIFQAEGERPTWQVAPFIDVGGAWNNDRPTPQPRTIASAGIGLRWDPSRRLHAQLYWGHAFNNVVNPSDTLQDDGFHFLVSASLFD